MGRSLYSSSRCRTLAKLIRSWSRCDSWIAPQFSSTIWQVERGWPHASCMCTPLADQLIGTKPPVEVSIAPGEKTAQAVLSLVWYYAISMIFFCRLLHAPRESTMRDANRTSQNASTEGFTMTTVHSRSNPSVTGQKVARFDRPVTVTYEWLNEWMDEWVNKKKTRAGDDDDDDEIDMCRRGLNYAWILDLVADERARCGCRVRVRNCLLRRWRITYGSAFTVNNITSRRWREFFFIRVFEISVLSWEPDQFKKLTVYLKLYELREI